MVDHEAAAAFKPEIVALDDAGVAKQRLGNLDCPRAQPNMVRVVHWAASVIAVVAQEAAQLGRQPFERCHDVGFGPVTMIEVQDRSSRKAGSIVSA